VLLGKTNLHEFAYGITSENPHFGPVHNPWAADRISGGSSGGSAAAVAAGLCAAAIGSDTGGSIRVPAALCGIVGLKPTFGRVSVHGVMPLAPSFDHIGPITRCVGDAAVLLETIAGRDPLDPTSVGRPHRKFLGGSAKPRKPRLGRPAAYFWTRLDAEVRRLSEGALESLARQGATIEEVALPSIAEAVEAANLIAAVEARETHEKAGYFPARAVEYGRDVRERLERAGDIRALDYRKAQEVLRRARAEFEAALDRVAAIVTPTTPVAAPPIGSDLIRVGDAEESVRGALLRANRPANFTGLPALSIPCGFTRAGLPVGLELIGGWFDESTLLGIARLYERQHPWCSRHPQLG
jgi:aspartyl-tRNA(Asn)/glutamyl-tRNA(Gln) amidotransferase subunit A